MNVFENIASGGLFLIIGIVALVILVISFILDGLFEFFDFGDGVLNLTTLTAFISIFGFSGYLALNAGVALIVAIIIGIIAGLAAALGAMFVMRALKASQSSDSISTSDVIGQEATVSLIIREGRAGEVSFLKKGQIHYYTAYSEGEVRQGSTVMITSILSNDSVRVKPIVEETF